MCVLAVDMLEAAREDAIVGFAKCLSQQQDSSLFQSAYVATVAAAVPDEDAQAHRHDIFKYDCCSCKIQLL